MRIIERLRRRRDDDRGAALVEAALTMPILVLILFGIFELGFLFATAQTANSSSRAGARQAAQQYALTPDSTTAGQVKDAVVADLQNLDSFGTPVEVWLYEADANGDYVNDPTFTSCAAHCIRFHSWNGSDFTTTSGSWFSASPAVEGGTPDACGDTVDSLGIYTRVTHDFISGFFGDTRDVEETTVMHFEPKQDGSCPASAT